MDKSLYDSFFSSILYPCATTLVDHYEGSKFDSKILSNNIYDDYENYKSSYKIFFDFTEESRLDRHKVCAAITISILNNNPISTPKNNLLNEYFALQVSTKILKHFIHYEIHKKDIKEAKKMKDKRWFYPKQIKSESQYPEEFIKLLNYCKQDFKTYKKGSFAVHLSFLAHLFYHIEVYALSRIYPNQY